jgi:hypothetical protein
MSIDHLKKDEHGDVITFPVRGFTTATAEGMAILFGIDYAETPLELETGGKSILFVLTPQQALSIAQALTTAANKILHDSEACPGPLN